MSNDGYPLYSCRSPKNGGRTITIKFRQGYDFKIDNTWIECYCPLLSKMFNSHTNIEMCNSVIKYIFKYIKEGCDKAIYYGK